MEKSSGGETILKNLNKPAFIVADGTITQVNPAAAQRFAETGMRAVDLIATGSEEYAAFHSGNLYLNICLAGTQYPCSISVLPEGQLFIIEEDTARAELQALALASQQLNMPVSEISLLVDKLSGIDSEDKAKINQNLFRLRRMLNNMADAAQLSVNAPRLTGCEMCSVFEEILEKAGTLLSQNNIPLQYRLPNHCVYSSASPELLRRAVYNLISNAAKFSPAGSAIEATLTHTDKRLLFSVTSSLDRGLAGGNLFSRYTRQPGLEDPRLGLGLGMTLIHAAATAHGGTVLWEELPGSKLRITMSLSIKQGTSSDVRSPILIPDIYAGSDQALIELSDVLDYHLYSKL